MKNSIYLIVLFIFCIPKKLKGQNIEDFGKKSFNQIQTMNKYKPCDIVYNKLLLYCVENGNKIAYIFNSGILNAYQLHTYYSNQFEAKQAVKQRSNVAKQAIPVYQKETKDLEAALRLARQQQSSSNII